MFAACFKRGFVVLALFAAPVSYAELVIEDAWVRAVPPNSRTTAAYFTVRNSGDKEQVIVRASASVAGAAEIHDWIETDGRKRWCASIRCRCLPARRWCCKPADCT